MRRPRAHHRRQDPEPLGDRSDESVVDALGDDDARRRTVQRWPWRSRADRDIDGTLRSSSSTTSRSCRRFRAGISRMRRRTGRASAGADQPVKVIGSMAGLVRIVLRCTEPRPMTSTKTPSVCRRDDVGKRQAEPARSAGDICNRRRRAPARSSRWERRSGSSRRDHADDADAVVQLRHRTAWTRRGQLLAGRAKASGEEIKPRGAQHRRSAPRAASLRHAPAAS